MHSPVVKNNFGIIMLKDSMFEFIGYLVV